MRASGPSTAPDDLHRRQPDAGPRSPDGAVSPEYESHHRRGGRGHDRRYRKWGPWYWVTFFSDWDGRNRKSRRFTAADQLDPTGGLLSKVRGKNAAKQLDDDDPKEESISDTWDGVVFLGCILLGIFVSWHFFIIAIPAVALLEAIDETIQRRRGKRRKQRKHGLHVNVQINTDRDAAAHAAPPPREPSPSPAPEPSRPVAEPTLADSAPVGVAAHRAPHVEAAPPNHARGVPRPPAQAQQPMLTGGNIVLLVIGLLLSPIWLIITFFMIIGPFFETVGRIVVAVVSSGYCFFATWNPAYWEDHNAPRRRMMGEELARDWKRVASSLGRMIWQGSRPWGLGNFVLGVGRRIDELSARYDHYLTRESDVSHTPEDFRETYHVVDQLPSGGSSARVYVVRKAEGEPDKLYVLKYFDLSDGSRLEAVVRESQAVELARRLGLIVDSRMGSRSFYYVMPYYRGDVATKRALDEFRAPGAPQGASPAYARLSLGWIHQLLQLVAQYHEAGVIHKDIKPDNLIVSGEYLYLVDIGLMTPLESLQQLTTHGTEYFRDPEMVRMAMAGQAVRDVNAAKFDLYAVGAVLFFLFEADIPAAGSLSRFTRPVPRAVQLVVSRAMAPFERRYETARLMLADVDYLCWAAAQGTLDAVRPADLPSFRAQSMIEESGPQTAAPEMAYASHPPAYAPGNTGRAPAGAARAVARPRHRSPWRLGVGFALGFVFAAAAVSVWLYWPWMSRTFFGAQDDSGVSVSPKQRGGSSKLEIGVELQPGLARDLALAMSRVLQRGDWAENLNAQYDGGTVASKANLCAMSIESVRRGLSREFALPDFANAGAAVLTLDDDKTNELAREFAQELRKQLAGRGFVDASGTLAGMNLGITPSLVDRMNTGEAHGMLLSHYVLYVREQQLSGKHPALLPLIVVVRPQVPGASGAAEGGSVNITLVFPGARAVWHIAIPN